MNHIIEIMFAWVVVSILALLFYVRVLERKS
jgi:hypothetical protein